MTNALYLLKLEWLKVKNYMPFLVLSAMYIVLLPLFMASHMLDEVEKVCSHVAIIKNGNLLMTGEVGSLLNKDMTIEIAAQNNEILRGVLSEASFISSIETKPNFLIIQVKEGYSTYDVNQLAIQKGIVLTHLNERKRRLEEEFLQITSKN